MRNFLLAMLMSSPLLFATQQATGAEDTARARAIEGHVVAIEQSWRDEDRAAVRAVLERGHFSPGYLSGTTAQERQQLLDRIADAAAQASGVFVDEIDNEMLLTLEGTQTMVVVFSVEDSPPFLIDTIALRRAAATTPAITLSWDSLGKTFARLERDGFSGVVFFSRNGKEKLHKAYGTSNAGLDSKTRLDSIYGIGSTPIDFTVAGIYLLAQRGKVSLDDTLDQYFDDVPAGKQSITIGHLISSRSGLPNFHDLPSDSDADLGWIDCKTAVRRILAQPLLFAPGESEAHSHSAYGLVAAILEQVSGQSYFEFLRDNVFGPAGMMRTGMYGMDGGFDLRDFAEGRGAASVGLPNIPPNWGPTSWLVLGSGGMYSTVGDLRRFYAFVRDSGALEPPFAQRWQGQVVGAGGSERGFYFFHAYNQGAAEAMMLINGEGRSPEMRALSDAIARLVMSVPRE